MRLFFAVLLPEEIREPIAAVQRALRLTAGDEGIRWVQPEQFHYTLKFLGETPDAMVPEAIEAASAVAAQSQPFTLTLSSAGAFPKASAPQVLWIGATEGVPVLTRLAESLDRGLSRRGFLPETRRFQPHLTLARIKTRAGEKAAAQALSELKNVDKINVDKLGIVRVEYFVLMKSELHPSGSSYTILETFALSSSSSS